MTNEMTEDEKRELYRQKFLASTIQNDFMFCHVMQDEAICTKVLNILLKDLFNIGIVKTSLPEATIKNHPELKFVRLDVLATDEKGNSYDIEMQVVNQKNIEKRMRSYQVAVDMFKLQSGMDYNALSNTIIIFLCPFDPFGAGLPVYFFEQCVRQYPSIKMIDGSYRVVFNTRAYKDVENEELRELLEFFQNGKATCAVAKEMEMKVSEIKRNSMLFEHFFSTFASITDARNDGRKEGRADGIKTTAKNLLKMGLSTDKIAQATGLSQEEIAKL